MSTFQKILRRYHLRWCIYLRQIIYQMEIFAINVFSNIINEIVHVHLTGYKLGSRKHRTHFDEAVVQLTEFFNFLKELWEALPEYQTRKQFQKIVGYYYDD